MDDGGRDVFEVIKKRRSIREFADKTVSKEDLKKIIDAARFSPTARGEEPWEFIVVTSSEQLGRIAQEAEHGRFIARAGACVAVYCKDTKYYLEDGCAATQNILLAAAALGLGSCWVAGDKKEYAPRISRMLGVPAGFRLVSLVALGFPADASALREKDKRPLSDLLHWDRY
jgi:nitroreductase